MKEKETQGERGKVGVGRRACTTTEFHDKISATDTPWARMLLPFVSTGETSSLPSIYIYTRFALHYNINIARNRRAPRISLRLTAHSMYGTRMVELEMILHPALYYQCIENSTCCDVIIV